MSIEIKSILTAILILIAAVVLSWVLVALIDYGVKKYFAKTSTQLDDVIIKSIKSPLRLTIIVAGLELALGRLSFIPADWQTTISDAFFIVYLVLIFSGIYLLIGGLATWYGEEVAYNTDTELDDKFLTFFRALARIIVSIIALIILLGHFGIEPSALITTLGISSLAIALAAQETLSDVISGFMIMLDQPFAIGDRVALLDIDTWGDVVEVGLRSTRILTRDNRLVTVPNSVIGKGLIVNYSDPNTVYRVETHVGVAYGTDLDYARQTMIEALESESWVMKEKPVEALMLEFGDSALIFRVRCWIEDYVETRRVMDRMNSTLYSALKEAEIEIPFPRQDINLRQYPTGLNTQLELGG